MLDFLATFGNYVVTKAGIDINTRLGVSLSFFIEDTIKIFLLIYVMIFVVSLFRAQLSAEKIKQYLSGKSRWIGYILAVLLGTVTPFCSCSSIPLFLAFIAAGIPFGVTMAFLISSPLISEVAAVLLLITPQAGLKGALVYVLTGAVIAIIGGYLCDKYKLEKYIKEEQKEQNKKCCCNKAEEKHEEGHHHNSFEKNQDENLLIYAFKYAFDTVKSIWVYVLIGLGIGAFMHGYIPQEMFVKYLGKENPFAVVFAAFAGIPIYANHDSVLPIVQVLLIKGVSIGTTLVMLMSITAISLPEMIMLNKVLKWKMIGIFTLYLFVAFIAVGYLMNFIL